jgi:NAD(P)H dehydrogenase (quinone)
MNSPPPVDHLVVLAHPDPGSFCASIAHRWQERARKNHQDCELRDLYSDGFDPVLKATEQPGKAGFAPLAENLAESRRLQQLDVLVFVYPVWFGAPPAMLKGYLERVVGSQISFGHGEARAKPLEHVRLVQIATSASEEPWLAEKGVRGALHTVYDRYLAEVFGAKHAYRLHLDSISSTMHDLHAATQLARVDELADTVCAEANAERWERAREARPPERKDETSFE